MEKTCKSHMSLFAAFWIGILTGALIVGLVFTYKNMDNTNLESSVLKYWSQQAGVDTSNIFVQPVTNDIFVQPIDGTVTSDGIFVQPIESVVNTQKQDIFVQP